MHGEPLQRGPQECRCQGYCPCVHVGHAGAYQPLLALHRLLHKRVNSCFALIRPSCALPPLLLQLQGMQVLHDTQLRRLPGYQGEAVLSAAVAGGGA